MYIVIYICLWKLPSLFIYKHAYPSSHPVCGFLQTELGHGRTALWLLLPLFSASSSSTHLLPLLPGCSFLVLLTLCLLCALGFRSSVARVKWCRCLVLWVFAGVCCVHGEPWRRWTGCGLEAEPWNACLCAWRKVCPWPSDALSLSRRNISFFSHSISCFSGFGMILALGRQRLRTFTVTSMDSEDLQQGWQRSKLPPCPVSWCLIFSFVEQEWCFWIRFVFMFFVNLLEKRGFDALLVYDF